MPVLAVWRIMKLHWVMLTHCSPLHYPPPLSFIYLGCSRSVFLTRAWISSVKYFCSILFTLTSELFDICYWVLLALYINFYYIWTVFRNWLFWQFSNFIVMTRNLFRRFLLSYHFVRSNLRTNYEWCHCCGNSWLKILKMSYLFKRFIYFSAK